MPFIIVLILFSSPFGSLIPFWGFEDIGGSLMRPDWPKLASLAQKTCYFCEPSCLFYLSFNFDFYVSKIMHL